MGSVVVAALISSSAWRRAEAGRAGVDRHARSSGAARTVPGATSPVLSPDGKRVAYVLSGELRVQPVGGGPVRTLTQVRARTRPSPGRRTRRESHSRRSSRSSCCRGRQGPVRLVAAEAWRARPWPRSMVAPQQARFLAHVGRRQEEHSPQRARRDRRGRQRRPHPPRQPRPVRRRRGAVLVTGRRASPSIWTSSAWRRSRSPAARASP